MLRLTLCLAIVTSVGPVDVQAQVDSPLDSQAEAADVAALGGEDDASALAPDAADYVVENDHSATQVDVVAQPANVPDVVDLPPAWTARATPVPTPAAAGAPPGSTSQPAQPSTQSVRGPTPPPSRP